MTTIFPVLDKGYVALIRCMGDDDAIAEAARLCYASEDRASPDADRRLIEHLIKSRPLHGTTLRHSWFTFRVKAPLFVCRQWTRHLRDQIHEDIVFSSPLPELGSHIDEKSLRYVDVSNFGLDYYVPTMERVGAWLDHHRKFVKLNDPELYRTFVARWTKMHDGQLQDYESWRAQGLPKELARSALGPAFYTEWEWTANLEAIFNWVYQRRPHGGAQGEHVEYALTVLKAVERACPIAVNAFRKEYLA